MAEANSLSVHVAQKEPQQLMDAAISSNNSRNAHREDFEAASRLSDKSFLQRIMVNYIRHRLTRYDTHLDRVAGRVGVRQAERAIRRRIYAEVVAVYPEFEAACMTQLAWRETLNAGWDAIAEARRPRRRPSE